MASRNKVSVLARRLVKEKTKEKLEVFNDLLNHIDEIKPSITLVRGLNNKQGFVCIQALLDYLEKRWLR